MNISRLGRVIEVATDTLLMLALTKTRDPREIQRFLHSY